MRHIAARAVCAAVLERFPKGRSSANGRASYTPQEAEFLMAMDQYKRVNRRVNPSIVEVLAVLLALDYRQGAAGTNERPPPPATLHQPSMNPALLLFADV